jgi:hypothetical protein
MATPLIGGSGSPGDGFLPATGFGPGSIVIALIGGGLTLIGAVMRRVGRSTPAAPN